MHPSNNLLLPILRKHGDRLLKAQIEAMVKELSWEEQELFLRRQLDASVEAIREKLATSYPDYPFLTEWEPEILKKSLKAWVFALSGERNYVLGIDDFTPTLTFVELGRPQHIAGYTAATNIETLIEHHQGVTRNGYKIKRLGQGPDLLRNSLNEIEEFVLLERGLVDQQKKIGPSPLCQILRFFTALKRP
jgi:fructose-1,6-bisphosphatase/inositol monophosphatase family enzyme